MKQQFLDLNGLTELVTYLKKSITEQKEILPYASNKLFPSTGNVNTIYIDTATNIIYRWDESSKTYKILAQAIKSVVISESTENGKITLTVDGKKTTVPIHGLGSAAYTNSSAYSPAGHTHTKAQVGLGNVDNTADANKSVKHATTADNATTAGSATTATNVSGENATGDTARHVWFSRSDSETKRVYNDNFKYNPATNLLTTNITGSAVSASNVPWTGVTGKPTTFTPSSHTHPYLSALSVSGKTITYTKGDGTTGTITTQDTWRGIQNNLTSTSTTDSLSAAQGKILKGLVDGKLSLSGGTMTGTAVITWPDSGNFNSNKDVTFPVKRGGLSWIGQSDGIQLFAEETANDNLELILKFTDDNSNGLTIRNKDGTKTARISASGGISATSFTGNLNGTASAAPWSGITGKPSTYPPSSHTHNYAGSSTAGGIAYNANALYKNPSTRQTSANYDLTNDTYAHRITYSVASSTMTTAKPPSDAHILTFGWDTNAGYGAQFAVGNSFSNHLYIRGAKSETKDNKNVSTWESSWRTVLDSGNYTLYTVTKTGSGASGTWGINVSGTASKATLLSPAYSSSTLTTTTSTWRNGVTEGNVVWGQSWKDTNLSGDTGDLTIWIKKNGSVTTANMTIDGTITAVSGFIGSLSGNASSATALTSSAGSATQPVYFSGGKPVACSYTLGKSVPADALFTDHTYGNMKGATSSSAGSAGLVPAPNIGEQLKFLRADGAWVIPTNTTYSVGTSSYLGITKLYTGTGSATDGTMTQSAITSALNGKSPTSHTHNYAGSSSAGGAATSAIKLSTPRKIGNASFDGTANITLSQMGLNVPVEITKADYLAKKKAGTLNANTYYNVIDEYDSVNVINDSSVTANSAFSSTKSEKTYAKKSTLVTTTLTASKWTGSSAPYTYVLPVSGATTSNIVEINYASNASSQAIEAYQNAMLADGGQTTNQITIKATEKPTVDIPITIVIRNDL